MRIALEKARRMTVVERLEAARKRAAAPSEKAIEAAFRRAVTAVSNARAKDIADAIASGNVLRLEQVLNWPEVGQPVFDAIMKPALVDMVSVGGAAEVRISLDRPLYALDITTPEAISWLRTSGAVSADQIKNARINALITYMEQAFRRGISVHEAALELKNLRIVGLNVQQVRAVANFRALLKQSGIVGAQAEKRINAYIARSLAYRAETIAMDLMTRAFAAGQRALWAQAVRDGFIDPKRAVVQWITLEDACRICVPLDRVTVPIGQPFPGGYLGPGDTHPRCRCMTILLPFGREQTLAA